jgi:hypothetical protein
MVKTPKIIPVPAATQRTKYSDKHYEERFKNDSSRLLREWTVYVLWECSTEFMVTNGMPTDADVKCWINWLQSRSDSTSPDIQSALGNCSEYIKPAPELA